MSQDESLKNIIRSFLNDLEYLKGGSEKLLSFCFHAVAACMTRKEFARNVHHYRQTHKRTAR